MKSPQAASLLCLAALPAALLCSLVACSSPEESLAASQEAIQSSTRIPVQIGIFNPTTQEWWLDSNGDGRWGSYGDEILQTSPLVAAGDTPIVPLVFTNMVDGAFRRPRYASMRLVGYPSGGNEQWEVLDNNFSVRAPFSQPGTPIMMGGAQVIFNNGVWAIANENYPNEIIGNFGGPGDIPVVGDWTGDGEIKMGIYNPIQGVWCFDKDANGTYDLPADECVTYHVAPGDLPVTGDWDGSGIAKIGVFNSGKWTLDMNGNHVLDGADQNRWFGSAGDLPVTGYWAMPNNTIRVN
jgi:hypothetical protein